MLVTEQQVEKALTFLADTDGEFANWRGQMLRTEHLFDVAKALAFKHLKGEGLGVEESRQLAITTEAVQKAHEDYVKCVVAWENLRARRKRAEITIDLYRTAEASRRKGTLN